MIRLYFNKLRNRTRRIRESVAFSVFLGVLSALVAFHYLQGLL